MSKFNKTAKGKTAVVNYMGAKSFKQSEKEELAMAVVTSFIEDSYYESKDKRVKRISKLVAELAKDDPEFIAKLAVITRREFHMRSAFHVLVGELSKSHKGDSLVKNTIKEGVERPDDLLEITSYLKKPIPNQVKKGISLALHKFDPYQLAKYKGTAKDFSLTDILNLTHPKPITKEESSSWGKLLDGEIETPETWEAKLSSEEGRKDKASVWRDMVLNKKIGYMALLRNLRNIIQQADSSTIIAAADMIQDEALVKRSKQLPFRFLSAYQALKEVKTGSKAVIFEKDIDAVDLMTKALNKAVEYSVQNLPLISGRTVILTDNSGSMRGDYGGHSLVSAMSQRTSADIGNLFSVLYWTRCENTVVGAFGDELLIPKLDREKTLFENFDKLNRTAEKVGGGTETGVYTMFERLIKDKTPVDRVIIFSDSQVGKGCAWYGEFGSGDDFNSLFQKFRKLNPQALTYSVQLKGYGDTLFSDGVIEIAGWSDKIFDLIHMVEKKDGFVKWIENYPLQLL